MRENQPRRYYYCKRLRMLEFLVKRGLRAVAVMPDKDNPRFNVWKFEKTPEFEKVLTEYLERRK